MCSIALTYPTRLHFQHTLNGKDGTRVRMNVAAHQEKEKNKKMGKRKAGEGRLILKRLRATLQLFRGVAQ